MIWGVDMADINKFLDKAYEGKSFAELADAPVAAPQAFGITTIADLATCGYVLWAQAINALSR